MKAYRIETRVNDRGGVHLDALPFSAGDAVEVIVLAREPEPVSERVASLRGMIRRYQDPTAPVADHDWRVLP